MNKRLRELAEQAGANFGEGLEFAVAFGEMKDFEKFLQLVVDECAYTARQCYYVDAIDAEDVAKHIEETLGSK